MTSYYDPYCHTSSIELTAEPKAAFGWMADGLRQGKWALGSLSREQVGDGLFRGTSWFDGGDTFVRITADPARLLIHYEVGRSPERLRLRTIGRVVPAEVAGLAAGRCLVTLVAWRDMALSEDAWQQMCVVHEAEMYRIRHLAERGETGPAP